MGARGGVRTVVDKTKQFRDAVKHLDGLGVGVGWPGSTAGRQDGTPLNNPTIAYILEHGAPEVNLPARPALGPGIERVQPKLNPRLLKAAQAAFEGRPADVDKQLAAAGLDAVSAVRKVITEGIQPPLAASTLRGRIRRHKGRLAERRELLRRGLGRGAGPDTAAVGASTELVKPWIDTAALLHALTYVIRRLKGK